MMDNPMFESRIDAEPVRVAADTIRESLGKVIVGQDQVTTMLITALLADGHVLLEGVPGVAKTLTARLLARTFDVGFSRIQFTPDLMPSDLIGTTIYNQQKAEFTFRKGPLFSNIVLADEINRAPAKTQAALFEVMEEKQITADGTTWPLDPPFMVLATQNPVEQEGTYRLPEAQLDRFLFRIIIDYPDLEQEKEILSRAHNQHHIDQALQVQPVLTAGELQKIRDIVKKVHVDEPLIDYIARIVNRTRNNAAIYLGASPRASLGILLAAKAFAVMNGRDFVNPADVREVAGYVLNHRILLTPEQEMEGKTPVQVIRNLVENEEVPR